MFVGEVAGRAEEAINLYMSVFDDSKMGIIQRYGPGQEPDREGSVMNDDFMLASQWFAAMDSAYRHEFAFNEAISLLVNCDNQQEIDYYWDKLTAVPEAEQCGWLKDRFILPILDIHINTGPYRFYYFLIMRNWFLVRAA